MRPTILKPVGLFVGNIISVAGGEEQRSGSLISA